MPVKRPIPADSVHVCAQFICPGSPDPCDIVLMEIFINAGKKSKGLIISAVITVHDSPVGIVCDLELKPFMFSSSVCKIPGVDSVGPLHKTKVLIPAPGVGEHIMEGSFHIRKEILDPWIIPCSLPGKVSGLDKTVLHVRLYLDTNIFGPVFPLAEQFFRKGCEIIEYSSIGRLSFGKMLDRAFKVFFKVFHSAEDVAEIPDPERFCIRRAVPSDGFAIDDDIEGILL